MKKKLVERTMRMRDLEVQVYGLKQEMKDKDRKIREMEADKTEKEREIRRL